MSGEVPKIWVGEESCLLSRGGVGAARWGNLMGAVGEGDAGDWRDGPLDERDVLREDGVGEAVSTFGRLGGGLLGTGAGLDGAGGRGGNTGRLGDCWESGGGDAIVIQTDDKVQLLFSSKSCFV